MTPDAIAEFYQTARSRRTLPSELADRLQADPTLPATDLGDHLESLRNRPELPAEFLDHVETVRRSLAPPELAALVDQAFADAPPAGDFIPEEYNDDEPDPNDAEPMTLAVDGERTRPRPSADEPTNLKLWLGLGVGLWVLAIVLWIVYLR